MPVLEGEEQLGKPLAHGLLWNLLGGLDAQNSGNVGLEVCLEGPVYFGQELFVFKSVVLHAQVVGQSVVFLLERFFDGLVYLPAGQEELDLAAAVEFNGFHLAVVRLVVEVGKEELDEVRGRLWMCLELLVAGDDKPELQRVEEQQLVRREFLLNDHLVLAVDDGLERELLVCLVERALLFLDLLVQNSDDFRGVRVGEEREETLVLVGEGGALEFELPGPALDNLLLLGLELV